MKGCGVPLLHEMKNLLRSELLVLLVSLGGQKVEGEFEDP